MITNANYLQIYALVSLNRVDHWMILSEKYAQSKYLYKFDVCLIFLSTVASFYLQYPAYCRC